MSCAPLERIYDYLDGGLSAAGRAAFEAHLGLCPACRKALDERRAIAEAATSLPPLEVPDDFVLGVMSRLDLPAAEEAPAKRARGFRLAPALAGASALGAVAIVLSLVTGNGLFGIILGLGRSLRATAFSTTQGILKAAKVVVHIGKMAADFLSGLIEGIGIATSFISPEVQIAVVLTVLVGTLAGGIAYGRMQNLEKEHGQI
jgi:anti-sigma factor RsiW